MKLISMTDFVTHQEFGVGNQFESTEHFYNVVTKYARFLKQPLELWMFVPCDEDGNVLAKPQSGDFYGDVGKYDKCIIVYGKSKERVLFEDFKVCNRLESVKCVVNGDFHFSYDNEISKGAIIESLVKYNLIDITSTAQKQIFG